MKPLVVFPSEDILLQRAVRNHSQILAAAQGEAKSPSERVFRESAHYLQDMMGGRRALAEIGGYPRRV